MSLSFFPCVNYLSSSLYFLHTLVCMAVPVTASNSLTSLSGWSVHHFQYPVVLAIVNAASCYFRHRLYWGVGVGGWWRGGYWAGIALIPQRKFAHHPLICFLSQSSFSFPSSTQDWWDQSAQTSSLHPEKSISFFSVRTAQNQICTSYACGWGEMLSQVCLCCLFFSKGFYSCRWTESSSRRRKVVLISVSFLW